MLPMMRSDGSGGELDRVESRKQLEHKWSVAQHPSAALRQLRMGCARRLQGPQSAVDEELHARQLTAAHECCTTSAAPPPHTSLPAPEQLMCRTLYVALTRVWLEVRGRDKQQWSNGWVRCGVVWPRSHAAGGVSDAFSGGSGQSKRPSIHTFRGYRAGSGSGKE